MSAIILNNSVEMPQLGYGTIQQFGQQITDNVAFVLNNSYKLIDTACRYCEDNCPQNIAVSSCFALYNEDERASVNYVRASRFYYKALTQNRGKASDCIECGLCEQICPQKLSIRENLKKVTAKFEK